jgi:beta-glucosidase/6-phospho-beta-glucosidase/beta-galactosidase
MLAATQHDRFVHEDFARLAEVQIRTVRDTTRWHRVEASPGVFDFASVEAFADAANAQGIQVVWDLLHYGVPAHVNTLSPDFAARFGDYAGAVARFLAARIDGTPVYTPINEISFYAWAAAEMGWFHPYMVGRGREMKRQLVKGWIAAVDAIRAVRSDARFVSVEPLIQAVPPHGQPDREGRAAIANESQFEAWDMLLGLLDPDLGGGNSYLDIVGVNFYHSNQWEEPGRAPLHWHVVPRDPRWVPFSVLAHNVYRRYGRPMVVGETSHVGVGRADWLCEMAEEVTLAIDAGVPLEGLCLYPILDRHEWDDSSHWHNSGLWDLAREPDGTLRRVLNGVYADALGRCQLRLGTAGQDGTTTASR